MPVYVVEIDGQQYDIEGGDQPPTEAEARAAVAAHTSQPRTHNGRPLPAGPTAAELAETTPHTQRGGVVRRLLEPAGDAAMALLSLPGAAAHIATETFKGNYGGAVTDAGNAVIAPQVEQLRHGAEAMGRGNVVEGVGRMVAGAVPMYGPAAADIADTAVEGNVAGAIGKAVMLAAPAPKFAGRLSKVMNSRAAARILGVMRPTLARMATAEKIAHEVVGGVAGREAAGGIGVGTRAELAKRARERAVAAGKTIEGLQFETTPVNPAPISAKLRDEAARRQTRYPERETVEYRDTGLVDEFGDPVVEPEVKVVSPPPTSRNQPLVDALRGTADEVDTMVSRFGNEDGTVPAGELFRSRAATNERIGSKAYEKLPGQTTAPHPQADKMFTEATSDLLHDERWGPGGLGGSKILDNEYHVWSKAATNLKNSRLRDMMGRDGKQVINLLAGRLAGAMLGGATGLASGYGPIAGVAGATLGLVLGESAYWGSLRAATYKEIARLLKAGDIDGAATIIQRTAATYAIAKASEDRERNRRAHAALQNQAKGVVGQ